MLLWFFTVVYITISTGHTIVLLLFISCPPPYPCLSVFSSYNKKPYQHLFDNRMCLNHVFLTPGSWSSSSSSWYRSSQLVLPSISKTVRLRSCHHAYKAVARFENANECIQHNNRGELQRRSASAAFGKRPSAGPFCWDQEHTSCLWMKMQRKDPDESQQLDGGLAK